ncbi:MAG TPA: carboxypeptidase-like regulatory domain-containing protein [Verrucomicrobiae bacterium]|nr:carboxypeptidase-like regulatory domain-containing protein [Verrucomicrobiae bacterium]
MTYRSCFRPFLASLLFWLCASPAFAGTVSGTVTNGTTDKPAAGVDVILIQLQGTMQPVAQTKTDAAGHYRLDHPALGAGPMLIRAVYRGVNYHEPATPGKSTVDIEVFEPTDKASAFAVTARAIILEPSGPDLIVDEEYLITNKTQPPVAYYKPGGSFEFEVPADAQLGDVAVVGTSGMPVKQSPVAKGKNAQAIDYPFRPGDSSVRLSYKIAYPGNAASLKFMSPYTISRVAVFAPPGMQVTGNGFAPAGQQQGFNVFMHESIAANTLTPVSVAGTGTMPQSQSADGGAASDDSQNPAVNSRAESSAPIASVTSLPARLDSVRWYVVGGFAAIFALGLLYIWRQPQVAVANSATESTPKAEPAKAAPVAAKPKESPPPKSSNGGATSLDREVRGSLDELKDVLFRLELRREAGTITEEEYVSERDRVQRVLRELVKG